MTKTLDQFKTEIEKLNAKFRSINEEPPFVDGPLDVEEYFYSKPYKILWLMKEAYGEPFSYPEFFTKEYDKFFKDLVSGSARSTWAPVVYVSYSLLNNFISWEQMDYIKDAPAMASILSKVAWVNINKMPASNGSVSPASNIREAKVKYINLLKEQIDLLAPDIVICGNTFQFIEKEFGSPQPHNFDSAEKFVPHYVINNTLWIDPFHPGYAGRGFVDMGLYINDIIRTIKKYFNSYQ